MRLVFSALIGFASRARHRLRVPAGTGPSNFGDSSGSLVLYEWPHSWVKGPGGVRGPVMGPANTHLLFPKKYVEGSMARCAFCKTQETQSREYGVPVCPDCLDIGKRKSNRNTGIRSVLFHGLAEAKFRFEAVSTKFSDIPGGRPRTDGAQRVLNASSELAAARIKRKRAQDRLDDYLSRGIVPEDLKQGD